MKRGKRYYTIFEHVLTAKPRAHRVYGRQVYRCMLIGRLKSFLDDLGLHAEADAALQIVTQTQMYQAVKSSDGVRSIQTIANCYPLSSYRGEM